MKKECTRCLFTSDFVTILQDGECEYCKLHDNLEKQSNQDDLKKIISTIKSKNGKYNCLIGISGGLDSSTLLYMAVRNWGLSPLVIHFDNNWNNEIAKQNMDNLINILGVDAIIYRVNKSEYDSLNMAFLSAGVPDADIPNDIAMTKLMYDTADKYGIKYILNGHDFREEGSTPAKWTYMDAAYIQDVYHKQSGSKLKNYPLFTFRDQIIYSLKGIKQVRPFWYIVNRKEIELSMINECKWQSYGGKHCENIYTEFVGAYLLPAKFNIDKRIVYLSARVRSLQMQKKEAKKILLDMPTFDFNKLGVQKNKIMNYSSSPIGNRDSYKKYNFKKYKLLVFILVKLRVLPYTFYKKYAC